MKRNRILLMAIGTATLVVAWYLFRPERLFVDSFVSETLEAAVAPAAMETVSVMSVALAQGHFRPVHHAGAGTATVYRFAGGTRVLRLTDFATDNGPDLDVNLVASVDAPDNETVRRARFVSLGRLKGNMGDQNYPIPADVDLARYRTVSGAAASV